MDNFIYILLVIALIIYSFYKNEKKRSNKEKTLPNQPEAENHSKSSTRAILEEILLGEDLKTNILQPEQTFEPITEQTVNKSLSSEQKEKEPTQQKSPIIKEQKKDIRKNILLENEEKTNEYNHLNFDLKKAVIFSEILKRPY